MKSFTDSTGLAWLLKVTVNTARLVRARTGVDLFNLFGEQAGQLLADPCKLVEVLYVLLEEQAKAAGISPEQFGERMLGDALEAAGEALIEAVIDFFPQSRRPALLATVAKAKAVGEAMNRRVMSTLDAIDPETFLSTGSAKPTALPATSTPVPFPSES